MSTRTRESGVTLIEVLVTMVILALGLVGVVGLQARMQLAEMESYQRSQALLLLNDMATRVAANRSNAVAYVTGGGSALGGNANCPTATATPADLDVQAWCNALKGASTVVDGRSAGAMIGGRGCIQSLPNNEYLLTVAWQGMTPLLAPSPSVECGASQFDQQGTSCTADRCRRVVTTIVRIAALTL